MTIENSKQDWSMRSPEARLQVGARTDVGHGRRVNEDAFYAPPVHPRQAVPAGPASRAGRLYLVADGMGGFDGGEVASAMAADLVPRFYYADPQAHTNPLAALQQAMQAANSQIHQAGQDSGREKMGTTLVAAVIREDELYLAHVGDSRAYLLRQGILRQLTKDHTWVAEQVRDGVLSTAEARRHDLRHLVTRAVGEKREVEVELQGPVALSPQDTLLLCSDGLWEPLGDQGIRRVIGRATRAQHTADALIAQAKRRKGSDNITAIVITGPEAFGSRPALAQTISDVWPGWSPRNRLQSAALAASALLVGVILIALILANLDGGEGVNPTPTATTVSAMPAPIATDSTVTLTATLDVSPTATPVLTSSRRYDFDTAVECGPLLYTVQRNETVNEIVAWAFGLRIEDNGAAINEEAESVCEENGLQNCDEIYPDMRLKLRLVNNRSRLLAGVLGPSQDGARFELLTSDRGYWVQVTPGCQDFHVDSLPEVDSVVRVSGFGWGDDDIQAYLVETLKGTEWTTLHYCRPPPTPIWVYARYGDWASGIVPPDVLAELANSGREEAAILGTWRKGEPFLEFDAGDQRGAIYYRESYSDVFVRSRSLLEYQD